MYREEEMLMLSGIQHYRFCPRQWALIHIDQQWEDNKLTVEGHILHTRVDDPFYRQKCGDHIMLRSVNIASRTLGLYGVTDVVELRPAADEANCISHPKYPGRWTPYPVEYKRGKPKRNETDEVQLAAQAMCLEEMYAIRLQYGAIFYGEVKHRMEVEFTPDLRRIVRQCAKDMHRIFAQGTLPHAHKHTGCTKCSLYDICLPIVSERLSAHSYLEKNLYAETS